MRVDDALLPIGRFAHLTGLTIHALRHYDDVDLLCPADVDPVSGYRRYHQDQLSSARLIKRLRWLGMPLDEIRQAIASPEATAAAVTRQRIRLERQASLLHDQIAATGPLIQIGAHMSTNQAGCRPCQLKITVTDGGRAMKFYAAVFGAEPQVIRRTEDEDFYGFMFGQYGEPDFFLVHLLSDDTEMDRPGPSTFGLLVDDLDAVHRRALAAGAVETVAPLSPEGMPRCSAVRDPDDNWMWLYQA